LNSTWLKLGFSQELKNKPSTALGTSTASLYEMAIAYSAFANGGTLVRPVFIRSIKTSDGKLIYENKNIIANQEVLKESSTILLNAMLQKAMVEGTGSGMRNVYGVRLPLAGKTGTSQDYGDAWFLAYNPGLVVATRVGATYPVIHFKSGSNGSGSALALPIVAKTFQKVQKNKSMTRKYFQPFADLNGAYTYALDCEDYVDPSEMEKFFDDLFPDKSTTFEKASKKAQRKAKKENKKSWFKRLFSKKEE